VMNSNIFVSQKFAQVSASPLTISTESRILSNASADSAIRSMDSPRPREFIVARATTVLDFGRSSWRIDSHARPRRLQSGWPGMEKNGSSREKS
jgi:hypothetical protein